MTLYIIWHGLQLSEKEERAYAQIVLLFCIVYILDPLKSKWKSWEDALWPMDDGLSMTVLVFVKCSQDQL